jgi:hypothetical protein
LIGKTTKNRYKILPFICIYPFIYIGNFDRYFLTKEFNAEEFKEYKPSLRGSTVIKLDYGKYIFKDTYCFMPFSLAKLSKDY